MGGIYNIELLGGIVIWLFKMCKVPLKDCVNKNKYALFVGTVATFIIVFAGIYFGFFISKDKA